MIRYNVNVHEDENIIIVLLRISADNKEEKEARFCFSKFEIESDKRPVWKTMTDFEEDVNIQNEEIDIISEKIKDANLDNDELQIVSDEIESFLAWLKKQREK